VTPAGPIDSPSAGDGEALALVAAALGRLRFGEIRLTVHEGRPVQVDVTERTRLAAPSDRPT
jgi:hypothetical protein